MGAAQDVSVSSANGAAYVGGTDTLVLLDQFAEPRTFVEALAQLRPRIRGAQHWMDLVTEISGLVRVGVLVDADRAAPGTDGDAGSKGFAGVDVHQRMLADRVRTERYLAAIRQVVRPGDVVLDIGTGSGVLAIAAAQAGAARVYAMEASAIGSVARRMFAGNGVANVHLLEGLSTQLELPERADVLIAELIGNEPLGERIQEVTRDALKRLLKPGARLVPGRIRVLALPMQMPADTFAKRVITDQDLCQWREWYGIDFRELADYGRSEPRSGWVSAQSARDWLPLSEPVVLADIDLTRIDKVIDDVRIDGVIQADGELNAVLTCFEVDLAPGIRLSTLPAQVADCNHWRSPLLLRDPPTSVQAGDRFELHYRHGRGKNALALRI